MIVASVRVAPHLCVGHLDWDLQPCQNLASLDDLKLTTRKRSNGEARGGPQRRQSLYGRGAEIIVRPYVVKRGGRDDHVATATCPHHFEPFDRARTNDPCCHCRASWLCVVGRLRATAETVSTTGWGSAGDPIPHIAHAFQLHPQTEHGAAPRGCTATCTANLQVASHPHLDPTPAVQVDKRNPPTTP